MVQKKPNEEFGKHLHRLEERLLKDGEECSFGCSHHVTHRCEKCGRFSSRGEATIFTNEEYLVSEELNMGLREKVQEALDNAKENGYNFEGWSPGQIASDMIRHDKGLEDENFCELGCIILGLQNENKQDV